MRYFLFILICTIAYSCAQTNKNYMSDNILLKYNVDTTRMKVAVGNENIVVALKNSADKQDFAYIKPYCEDSLIVRLHTGKDNIQSHTDKEKAIFFLNSIFS